MDTPSQPRSEPPTVAAENDDFTRTIACGERALNLLKQLRAHAKPRNYELFYCFTLGTNKEFCDALRSAIQKDLRLTEEAADRLFHAYLAKPDVTARVSEVGSKIGDEMDDIMSLISSASEKAGKYGESLQGINEKLPGIESPQQLKGMLTELFETTKEMAEHNKVLERRLVESKAQIDELHMKLELTRLENFIDELTGLTTRKRFDQIIDLEMQQAEETDEALCLLLIDIDHFKSFNDAHGHQTGDQVLRLVGQTLKTNVKGRDCAARYGGEEFAVLLPRTSLKAAITVAQQFRVAVKTKELVKKSTKASLGHVTLSVGVACYRKSESATEFIERADALLYAAKEAGRDNVQAEPDPRICEAKPTAA
ncbi:MAG: GGDEF domain-containing protein [Hyphomicrobiaceae bacterium]|nr:GGDEF domain-containing protein [Hyphomicrobiaceae bacterium]